MNEYLKAFKALTLVGDSDEKRDAFNTVIACAVEAMKSRPLLEQTRFMVAALAVSGGAGGCVARSPAYVDWLLEPRRRSYLTGIQEDRETLAWVRSGAPQP